ncbi:MAG: toll/interleukin-1 receptor domain-containing protein, partial [Planctomycetaceae bacterium]|nr:toll/interleukin-1 receptor domain-containing protein [Planctomycetaceae bacterium]
MITIFLSYARGDDEPFVRRLHDDLKAHGFTVWFDRVSMPSRNLTFHQEIRDAVAAHERLLLVVGPKAAASEYVRQEWQFAWFEAEKVVTPILRLGEYPLAIDELKLVHAEDFRNDADYAFHLNELVRILNAPPAPMGKLIAVPSLPAHYLSRTDRLIPLRDAVRSGLDSAAPFGGMVARQQFHGIAGVAKHVGMHGMG